MKVIDYLDFLFYKIGRQHTDFELQIQNKDGFMSKRRKYSDVGFKKEKWFLDKANARTLMVNEVVLDMDPENDESEEEFEDRVYHVVKRLQQMDNLNFGVFESNRGVHIHIFFRKMFFMTTARRKEYRLSIIKEFKGDLHKVSERVTINLEFARHWKSGQPKALLLGNLLEV
jgi:hypothetical protein